MRYEINETTKEVRVYDSLDEEILYQPQWPDGTEWSSYEEAEAWVTQYLISRSDKLADIPGPSPENPTLPRPAAVEPPPPQPGSDSN